MSRRTYTVAGLDCPSESGPIRRELEQVAGVDAIVFDHARGHVTVTGEADDGAIRAAVAKTGMRAVPRTDGDVSARTPLSRFAALAGATLIAGIAAQAYGGRFVPFYLLTIAAGLVPVLPRAIAAARALRPDMHLLMTIAVCGAIAIGEWLEGATVSFLYLVSLVLEAWSVRRAHGAVEKLLELAPDEVTLADGAPAPAADVPVGTRILVAAGARVPLDGLVADGESAVDESPITGESLPVDKAAGDDVYAGSINGPAALTVTTTKPAGESTLAHMARLVADADARRGRTEQAVERFARVYTPAVVGLAVLLAAVPPLAFGAVFADWLYRALVLLVIACPCALVISTPVAIVAGLTAAARRGVLVKGGAALEAPAAVRVVAFDKTGTLTLGRPRVARVVPLHGHDEEEVLARAAAIATGSRHPLSRAVAAEARARGIDVAAPESIVEHGGLGVEGRFDGRPFWLGSRRFAEQRTDGDVAGAWPGEYGTAGTTLYVGNEAHLCGVVVVADELRPEIADDVARLRTETGPGAALVMLTGDRREVAEEVARATGVDDVRAQMLPEDKLGAIEELRREHGPVAMVGDGINDAPALAAADLGIAMGAIGSDAAIETADVALLGDEIARLPWLFRHSRNTKAIIAQNIAASLAIKAVFVALTLFGWSSLWAAIAADTGMTLAVIANSLRLLRG